MNMKHVYISFLLDHSNILPLNLSSDPIAALLYILRTEQPFPDNRSSLLQQYYVVALDSPYLRFDAPDSPNLREVAMTTEKYCNYSAQREIPISISEYYFLIRNS